MPEALLYLHPSELPPAADGSSIDVLGSGRIMEAIDCRFGARSGMRIRRFAGGLVISTLVRLVFLLLRPPTLELQDLPGSFVHSASGSRRASARSTLPLGLLVEAGGIAIGDPGPLHFSEAFFE